MVVTILVDVNLDGHGRILERRLRMDPWREFYDDLKITFLFFGDIGLDRETPDEVVWKLCQDLGYFLLTANRNEESDDSLGTTIRRNGKLDSLPVFTLADAERLSKSSAYQDQVVAKLLEYLIDRSRYLGTGRLFLP
jgi:hypothetical protein